MNGISPLTEQEKIYTPPKKEEEEKATETSNLDSSSQSQETENQQASQKSPTENPSLPNADSQMPGAASPVTQKASAEIKTSQKTSEVHRQVSIELKQPIFPTENPETKSETKIEEQFSDLLDSDNKQSNEQLATIMARSGNASNSIINSPNSDKAAIQKLEISLQQHITQLPETAESRATYQASINALRQGDIKTAQSLFEEASTTRQTERINGLLANSSQELNENTSRIQEIQNYLDKPEKVETSFTKNQKTEIEATKTGELYQRSVLTRTHMEAQELIQAGELDKAESLLRGEINFHDLSMDKLRQSNPNAAQQTNPDGTVKTDEQVIKDTRAALQETINVNRGAIEQLEKQIQSISEKIDGTGKSINELGLMQDNPQLSTQEKLSLMEHKNLAEIQVKRLAEETHRLFTAHDRITQLANNGESSRARDVAEGREAVLSSPFQKVEGSTSTKELQKRGFQRSSKEEKQYQAFKQVQQETTETQQQIGILIRGDNEYKQGGSEHNIAETQQEISESGLLSYFGGRTEALRAQLGAEQNHKEDLSNLESSVKQLQTKANELVTQGKYEEAKALLENGNTVISDSFQSKNNKLIQALQGVNGELEQFDRNLKDTAVQVSKTIAVTSLAMALAPTTGGGSLAMLTSLGTATFASAGLAFAIDTADAGINMAAFDESFSEAGGRVVSADNVYNNFKTAFIGATGGAASKLTAGQLQRFNSLIQYSGSQSVAAGTMSIMHSTEQRVQAEIAFNKALTENPNLDKENFMRERGVAVDQIAKSLTVDTTVGLLSGFAGLRAGAAKETAKTIIGKSTIEVAEEITNMSAGLAGAYINDGKITPETMLNELMAATAGNRASHYSQRVSLDTPASTNNPSRRDTPTERLINPNQDSQARTTLEIDPTTGQRKATKEYQSEATASDPRVEAEEDIHAKENIIDPGKIDPETGKAEMELPEYQAKRALKEAVAQQAAEAKTHAEGASKAKESHSENIKEINAAINAGEFDKAISLAKESNYINDKYLKQYEQDYKHNTNPENTTLKQTSFSTTNISENEYHNKISAEYASASPSIQTRLDMLSESFFSERSDTRTDVIEALETKSGTALEKQLDLIEEHTLYADEIENQLKDIVDFESTKERTTFNDAIKNLESGLEALKDFAATNGYNEEVSRIESIQERLKTIQPKIEEINSKDKISNTDINKFNKALDIIKKDIATATRKTRINESNRPLTTKEIAFNKLQDYDKNNTKVLDSVKTLSGKDPRDQSLTEAEYNELQTKAELINKISNQLGPKDSLTAIINQANDLINHGVASDQVYSLLKNISEDSTGGFINEIEGNTVLSNIGTVESIGRRDLLGPSMILDNKGKAFDPSTLDAETLERDYNLRINSSGGLEHRGNNESTFKPVVDYDQKLKSGKNPPVRIENGKIIANDKQVTLVQDAEGRYIPREVDTIFTGRGGRYHVEHKASIHAVLERANSQKEAHEAIAKNDKAKAIVMIGQSRKNILLNLPKEPIDNQAYIEAKSAIEKEIKLGIDIYDNTGKNISQDLRNYFGTR